MCKVHILICIPQIKVGNAYFVFCYFKLENEFVTRKLQLQFIISIGKKNINVYYDKIPWSNGFNFQMLWNT